MDIKVTYISSDGETRSATVVVWNSNPAAAFSEAIECVTSGHIDARTIIKAENVTLGAKRADF